MKRINYIDALRGVTMFLVVFAHVMHGTLNLGGYDTVIGTFFITFRMPMFFFISGYIAYKESDFWNLRNFFMKLKNKSFVQIIPALLFFILFMLCFTNKNVLEILVSAYRNGFGGYWFTFVLFEMFCVYYIASLISHYTTPVMVDIILVVASLLGIAWLSFASREGSLDAFLSMEKLAKYMQFFTFGILCRKHKTVFESFLRSDLLKAGVIITFVIGFYFFSNEELKRSIPLLFAFNHDILVRYCGLLTLFMFFWVKQDYFNEDTIVSKCLVFVGRRTLDIYLLHYFFIPQMHWLTPYLAPSSMLLVQLFLSLFISALIVAVCLLCSEIIRSSNLLAHFCFGVKRVKSKNNRLTN